MSNIPTTLHSLYSILLIPDGPENPIHTFHKSFPDFLTGKKWCKYDQFFVHPAIHHAEIPHLYLNLVRERLKRNICNLDDYVVLSEVEDLSTGQKDCIGDVLKYTCCFWTKHPLGVPSTSPYIEEVQRAIDQFFTTHLLH